MKTFVAPLLTSNGTPILKPSTAQGEPIHWLDEILKGGIYGPMAKELGRPLVILLAGPPGAGKSLLAQQICYNIARDRCDSGSMEKALIINSGSSLYVTTESSARAILRNMNELGLVQHWSEDERLCTYDSLIRDEGGKWSHEKWGDRKRGLPLMSVVQADPGGDWFSATGDTDSDDTSARGLKPNIECAWQDVVRGFQDISLHAPSLVVIDSLNVLPSNDDKATMFSELLDLFTSLAEPDCRPKFLLLLLDTVCGSANENAHAFWEYVSDLSIRLDYGYEQADYFTRQIEIIKARHQSHTLGKHVVKIYAKPERQTPSLVTDPEGQTPSLVTDPEGPRPNIQSGGVFVFPSVHYVLSSVRAGQELIGNQLRRPTLRWSAEQVDPPGSDPCASGPGPLAAPLNAGLPPDAEVNWTLPTTTLNWPTPWCFELIGGGVPLNQCTALIGRRGARKSYFAYQFLLDGICNGEQTLVISFRDNADGIRTTMNQIGRAKPYQEFGPPKITNTNPVIIYQRPGYVAPEELFHRIITAVGEFAPTRLIINAVDQWDACYPLLARCSILLPALIDFFNTHHATSMVIGVDTAGTGPTNTGLTAKAEVVLSFEFRRIPWPATGSRRSGGSATDLYPRGVMLKTISGPGEERLQQAKVVVRAIRVPRGAAGFGRAVLEYTMDDDIGQSPVLTMMPLAPEYPEGQPV